MSFMLAEGEEAKRQSEQQNNAPSKKYNYVKLKAGESMRVMILDPMFPSFYSHGDYTARIPSHVCTAPKAGMSCRSCDAGVKRSLKYLVPLYDVDKKELVLWETGKKHVQTVYALIDTYGEDVTAEVFQLKRSGASAQDTAYSLIPLPPKQKASVELPDDVEPFEFGSQERSDFYEGILRAPSDEYLTKILAGVSAVPVSGQDNDHNF